MLNRSVPEAPPQLVFTILELRLLDALVKDSTETGDKTLPAYLTKLARLGGYLARASVLTRQYGHVERPFPSH